MTRTPLFTSADVAFSGLVAFSRQTSLEKAIEEKCQQYDHPRSLYPLILYTAYGIQNLVLNHGHKACTVTYDIAEKKKNSETFRAFKKIKEDFLVHFFQFSNACLTRRLDEVQEQTDAAEHVLLKRTTNAFQQRVSDQLLLIDTFLDMDGSPSQEDFESVITNSFIFDNTVKSCGTTIIGHIQKPGIFRY